MLERTEPVDSTGEHEETGKDGSQQIVDFGSALTKTPHGSVYCLTIIGQIEGHNTAASGAKTTKYEHVLPLLAKLEESDEVDGVLFLLNTVGGDVEAGLAIAELLAGMKSQRFPWCWEEDTPSGCPWRWRRKNPLSPSQRL